MTTDVIDGVPRSLLAALATEADKYDDSSLCVINDNCELWQIGHIMPTVTVGHLRAIRALLATAQPADHSEHDLNMVSQPAADGEREVWAVPVLDGEKKTTFYTEQLPFVPGIGVKQLGEPVRMVEARADQPQQTVAVTDEMRRLREALEELLGCPHNVVRATVPKAGIESAPPYQVVLDVSVSLTRWRKAQAALSAHKTGEEE